MNKIKILSLLSLLLFFIASCDKGFEDINKDPNNPTEIESGLLLADIVRISQNTLNSTFIGGDMGSCWSQQWAKVQYNGEEMYTPRGGVISQVWDDFYEDVASDAHTIYKLALAEENTNMQAVALVMKSYAFLILTDCYGDIPYSEALKGEEGITAPVYDEQSVVYDSVLVLLDKANSLFSADGGTINVGSDLLYGGNWKKWQKFGNSLKFRALMRISGVRDVKAELQEIVSNRDVFTSAADEAKLIYLSNDPNANPIYETIVFGTRTEFKVCEVLVNMLVETSDPRLEVYAQENTDGEYRGKPAGIFNVPNDDYNYDNVSPIGAKYLKAEAPGYFMSYPELLFLMAEAAQKGFITGSAQEYYSAGIAASMAANGITEWPTMTGLTLSSVSADALKQIAEQNWLALFCQGVEAWTEQRRTGYPVLTPAIDGVISEIPSRYTYPSTEITLNPEGYNAAIERQGANSLTTKVWWNK